MFINDPSANVPIAVKFCVAPTAKLFGEAGETAMEDNGCTANAVAGLVTPPRVAVILAVPAATAVAKPFA